MHSYKKIKNLQEMEEKVLILVLMEDALVRWEDLQQG